MRRRWIGLAGLVLLAVYQGWQHPSGLRGSISGHAQPDTPVEVPPHSMSTDSLARAIANQQSHVQVQGSGVVVKLLPDDRDGSPHQRFLVRLASGDTILIVHNIDLAARLDDLAAGEAIDFAGEYIWNDKGGLVHWTHHDPAGRHAGGWLRVAGRTYQ